MRDTTPSFILTLPLKISSRDEKELLSRFESARLLYNAVLGEAKKRVFLIRQSKIFDQARKTSKDKKKERSELFKSIREEYSFNEYSLHEYVGQLRHQLVNKLDIHTVQKLATRAFRAAERILYGRARRVRFKGYNQLNSVESKSNETGIRWRSNKVEWNGLFLRPIIHDDKVISYGLKKRVKYCRIVRKTIRGKNYFYVQLVLEGVPLIKEKNRLGKGVVSFDFGPSTVAIVSQNKNEFNARLLQFCSELKDKQKETRVIQRKIDRQRRKNNPLNYSSNGKIKKGRHRWKKSVRQKISENELKELYRTAAEYRKSLQGKLINETLRMGNIFKTEKVSRKWLQKNFGKSVGIRAPGMFVEGLKHKAESAGGSFIQFPTQSTKLSQTCICGRQKKKSLSERVHSCECGVHVQRDLLSAYLGLYVEKADNKDSYILQTGQCQRHWPSADTLLQMVWRSSVQSTSGRTCPSSFGKPLAFQSQSGSFAEERISKFKDWNAVVLQERMRVQERTESFLLEPTGF